MAKGIKEQDPIDDRDIAVRNKAKADLEKMLGGREQKVEHVDNESTLDDDTEKK
jgi:hypothetical protein